MNAKKSNNTSTEIRNTNAKFTVVASRVLIISGRYPREYGTTLTPLVRGRKYPLLVLRMAVDVTFMFFTPPTVTVLPAVAIHVRQLIAAVK
jgi:hypothetical protein